ncbi:MAG TPA: sulfite exporter TauE/SafE family protein [Steroidobacteraceae bacterium]|nr:sulfite exporter TauE/SafE family protein [Steroidobacteraceae bacterium]
MVDPAQSISGFGVGLIVGLTGVGGGSLMTPLLVLLFGIHPATAVGTDLLHAALTKAGGTYVHARQGRVDWRITAWLAVGSIPAAVATVLGLHHFAGRLGESRIITTVLGAALLLTSVALALRPYLRRLARTRAPQITHRPALTALTGLLLGFVVSISSVGAGALGVTALFFLYPQLKAGRVVASDLAHAVPLTLVAGIGHWMFGSVDWTLLLSLLIGSLPGILIGSHFAGRIPDALLRYLLSGMLLLVGGKLIAF